MDLDMEAPKCAVEQQEDKNIRKRLALGVDSEMPAAGLVPVVLAITDGPGKDLDTSSTSSSSCKRARMEKSKDCDMHGSAGSLKECRREQ